MSSKVKTKVEMWTDGACSGNPGPGGWGVLLRWGGHEKELYDGAFDTTNNRMEMMAAVMGLQSLKRPCKVKIHTDSKYVMQGMTEWLSGWKKNGWRTANKKPVKNADIWQMLEEAAERHDIEWLWVKGHADNEGNIRADELANFGMDPFKMKNGD